MAKAGGSKLIIKKKLTKQCNFITDWDNKKANPKHIRRMIAATQQEIDNMKNDIIAL